MGKASRWFRALFGLNKPHPSTKKWTFSRAHKQRNDHQEPLLPTSVTHAMAVAAASAAVAEAACAAANAAAAVVTLTSNAPRISGGCISSSSSSGASYTNREERAAVTIQSHFRAYLARKALRALKLLVKLQAVAKGFVFRKQFREYLRQMQAVARAQARLRAGRVSNSEASNSSTKSSGFNQNSPATPDKFNDVVNQTERRQLSTLKRNSLISKSNYGYYPVRRQLMDDERSDKILEMDPGKPTRPAFHSSQELTDQSWSPHSKRGPLTPTKSDGSKGKCRSGGYYNPDHPSYMAYTESSKAKVRSVSAPRQRFIHEEISSSMTRYSVHGFGNNGVQKVSKALHASFVSKAYPGSGRLDRMGMPVGDVLGFSGGHWPRFY